MSVTVRYTINDKNAAPFEFSLYNEEFVWANDENAQLHVMANAASHDYDEHMDGCYTYPFTLFLLNDNHDVLAEFSVTLDTTPVFSLGRMDE